MTQIDYPTFSGVDGPRDYGIPAQILEHWVSQPEMLELYATHYETSEVIPAELVEKGSSAANHNQGFIQQSTLLHRYWTCMAFTDACRSSKITDARAFEQQVLEGYGLIPEIEPRYRSQYFSHILPAGIPRLLRLPVVEILDADGFARSSRRRHLGSRAAARLQKWARGRRPETC